MSKYIYKSKSVEFSPPCGGGVPKGRGGDLLNLELPPPTPSLKRRGVKIQ
jgi:hypothetical protein